MDTRYTIKGTQGHWALFDGERIVEWFSNRGHALVALRGYVTRSQGGHPLPRARYSWRKVYRYLQAMGWRIELNEPPAVWWVHQGGGQRVKENRQLSARELLLSCYRNVPGDDKETLQAYWTWHKQHATTGSS